MAIINSKPAKVIEKEKTVDLTNYKIDLKTLDLQIIEKENCVKEKELYYEENDLKYYTSCLTKITDNNGVDLKKLLEAGKITFEDIFSTYTKEPVVFYDGGSKEYYFNNLTIIKCHTLNSINDVIIGSPITSIVEGFCDDNFKIIDLAVCSFNRTYYLKAKKDKADNESTYVVVKDQNGKEASVKIKNYNVRNLTFDTEYVFVFDNYKEIIKDSKIEDIFENYDLRAYGEKKYYTEGNLNEPICMPVSNYLKKKAYLYLSKENQKEIEHYVLAETDYKLIKELVYYDKNNKKNKIKNTEVIYIKFTKKDNSHITVVVDFKNKEILGEIL